MTDQIYGSSAVNAFKNAGNGGSLNVEVWCGGTNYGVITITLNESRQAVPVLTASTEDNTEAGILDAAVAAVVDQRYIYQLKLGGPCRCQLHF